MLFDVALLVALEHGEKLVGHVGVDDKTVKDEAVDGDSDLVRPMERGGTDSDGEMILGVQLIDDCGSAKNSPERGGPSGTTIEDAVVMFSILASHQVDRCLDQHDKGGSDSAKKGQQKIEQILRKERRGVGRKQARQAGQLEVGLRENVGNNVDTLEIAGDLQEEHNHFEQPVGQRGVLVVFSFCGGLSFIV